MKSVPSFEEFINEQKLNEIGEGSQTFTWRRVGNVSVDRTWMTDMSMRKKEEIHHDENLPSIVYEFKSDNAEYYVKIGGYFRKYTHIPAFLKPGAPKPQDYDLFIAVAFDTIGSEKEIITNFGEQYRVVTTVVDIIESVVKEIDQWKWVKLQDIHITPKLEDADEGKPITQSKRGRLYLEYIKKQGKRLPGNWTVDIKKGSFIIKNGKWSSSSGNLIQIT